MGEKIADRCSAATIVWSVFVMGVSTETHNITPAIIIASGIYVLFVVLAIAIGIGYKMGSK